MTKFEDQLYDDLMREHGATLAHTTTKAAPKRHEHVTARRVMLATGAGCLAVGAGAGALVASGHATSGHGTTAGPPAHAAYAVTKNPDGTVTLAVYKASGIAAANNRLRQLDDGQVVIVPVAPGCPSIHSLPAPAVQRKGPISVSGSRSVDGSMTVNAQGIPAGDILVVAVQTVTNGKSTTTETGAALTSPPAPACVSDPAPPPPPPGGSSGSGGSRSGHSSGSSG